MTKIKNKQVCGQCSYFMQYNDDPKMGDCANITMNKECNNGVNPFRHEDVSILQIDSKEEACALIRVSTKRTKRVKEYIKDHPNYYKQEK